MANRGKSFRGNIDAVNPAMQFISELPEPEPAPDEKSGKPPGGYKLNPIYIETKSRRLQLLIQPSLYEKIKARATAEGMSVNELVHSILDTAFAKV